MEQTQPTTSKRLDTHQATPMAVLHASEETGSSLAEIAHEARNMVAALGVYCDLLEVPGVFAEPYRHYGDELKLVAGAGRSLVSHLQTMSAEDSDSAHAETAPPERNIGRPTGFPQESKTVRYWDELPPCPIEDLAWELYANRSLLAALAGPSIALTVDTIGGSLPVRLNSEDLTRVLVNLIKNAVEAIPGSGGRIHLVLQECQTSLAEGTRLLLNIEDNGVGIPPEALERVFEAGFSKQLKNASTPITPQTAHRGLGLSISRSIIEAAGGQIRAANRDPVGACIQIELPVR